MNKSFRRQYNSPKYVTCSKELYLRFVKAVTFLWRTIDYNLIFLYKKALFILKLYYLLHSGN